MGEAEQFQIIGRVVLAGLLGGLVGLEREFADKPAGLRTHMLVACASALLIGLADAILERYAGELTLVRSDPIRIVEAVITGISFLGAGTIFRRKREEQIEGLTTAASLLLVSGIGMSVGLEQFVLAGGVTLLALLLLRGFRFIEQRIGRKGEQKREADEKAG